MRYKCLQTLLPATILTLLLVSFTNCAKTSSQTGSQSALTTNKLQYTATVDSTQDGCGTALCTLDQNGNKFCAYPVGIPQEELIEGTQFWVEGQLIKTTSSADVINACMGMIQYKIEIQSYRKL